MLTGDMTNKAIAQALGSDQNKVGRARPPLPPSLYREQDAILDAAVQPLEYDRLEQDMAGLGGFESRMRFSLTCGKALSATREEGKRPG